ncbi:MAG TPA: hypothetical protein PLJ21_13930 [Pseudobdellovibrionaceae bacterium]|nr:hypothetical protein [Pseudobdellovibrionaceae bacterium]
MEIKNLNENKTDKLVKTINATFGEIPIIGGALVELLSSVIPNQRIDRMVEFIKILNEKLTSQEQELLKSQILDENFNGLLQDVIDSTIKTIGKERKNHFAKIVQSGLTSNKQELIELRLITRILKEINDIEMIILKYHSIRTSNESSIFLQKNRNILESERLFVGASKEQEKQHFMYKGYLYHLVSLGLLDVNYEVKEESNRISDKSEFKINSKNHKITEFGKMIVEMLNE